MPHATFPDRLLRQHQLRDGFSRSIHDETSPCAIFDMNRSRQDRTLETPTRRSLTFVTLLNASSASFYKDVHAVAKTMGRQLQNLKPSLGCPSAHQRERQKLAERGPTMYRWGVPALIGPRPAELDPLRSFDLSESE
jgi:hypothetical protein